MYLKVSEGGLIRHPEFNSFLLPTLSHMQHIPTDARTPMRLVWPGQHSDTEESFWYFPMRLAEKYGVHSCGKGFVAKLEYPSAPKPYKCTHCGFQDSKQDEHSQQSHAVLRPLFSTENFMFSENHFPFVIAYHAAVNLAPSVCEALEHGALPTHRLPAVGDIESQDVLDLFCGSASILLQRSKVPQILELRRQALNFHYNHHLRYLGKYVMPSVIEARNAIAKAYFRAVADDIVRRGRYLSASQKDAWVSLAMKMTLQIEEESVEAQRPEISRGLQEILTSGEK